MQGEDFGKLQKMADAVRFLAADMVGAARSGHPGLPMGAAEFATALFARHLRFAAAHPAWERRDRFVLSAGHASAMLYSLLWLAGYKDITLDDLKKFRQIGAKTAGHPEYGMLAGIETTTGPLGQGLGTAVGMAIANRIKEALARGKHGKVWVLAGDGCLMEGISEEAISLAGTLGLSNLIVLWDDNDTVIDGRARDVQAADMKARFKACGWDIFESDGYDFAEIDAAFEKAKAANRPAFVAIKTIIGKGAPAVEGSAAAHGSPLTPEQLTEARRARKWDYAPFEIPADILKEWRAVGAKYESEAVADEKATKPAERPDLGSTFAALKKKFIADDYSKATRAASGEVLAAIVPKVPDLIGGTADLAEPTFTKPASSSTISRNDFAGNFIEYGIREHEMAACMNGLALAGFRPYGGTFLVFSDYMKPALRLSALMRLGAIYVLTHDSIFLGEDGPTHQPVEHIAALRAVPNLNVMRPADAIETAEAWEVALASESTPCAILLSRQAVPLARKSAGENMLAKGAYTISEAAAGKPKLLTLISTGSEVSLALEVQKLLLEKHGMNSAAVSMPSWFLFEKQSEEYRESVVDRETVCVSIEAASTFGWERWADIKIGLDTFGASGKADAVRVRFGFTPEQIAKKILAEL
ncbi:MAG: transketolase [Rickettsiales bacterium]|jgi:transketolase|nr:transketolase [Rickettsiales bacterium]